MHTNIKQAGSSIIVTVMVLMVLSLILAASVRTTLTSSYQASRALAVQELYNENHVALFFETDITNSANHPAITQLFNRAKTYADHEIVVCGHNLYMGSIEKWNSITWPATANAPTRVHGNQGYCNAAEWTNLVGRRMRVMTQTAIRYNPSLLASNVSRGAVATGGVYVVTVTSALPDMVSSVVPYTSITECFSNQLNDVRKINQLSLGGVVSRRTVAECLNALGVPAKSTTKIIIK